MDGRKNVIKEKDTKTDNILANKKTEVKLSKAPSKEKDVTSVSPLLVLQKDRTDGLHSSPATNILGIITDANATPDIRSRPGGWSVEVRGPNAASSSGQLHAGKSSSTTAKNSQQDTVIPSTAARPGRSSPTADIQECSVVSKPATRTPVDKDAPKPAQCQSTEVNQNSPAAAPVPAPRSPQRYSPFLIPAPRSHSAENGFATKTNPHSSTAGIQGNPSSAPKPAPRSPRCFLAEEIPERRAATVPAPRAEAGNKDVTATADIQKNPSPSFKPATEAVPPKSAHRCSLKLDVKPDEPLHSPTTDNLDTQNVLDTTPRSSEMPRTPSRLDDAAQMESRSNNQFIADENVSVWSSSIQIDRPLSTERICRICHESDQVEELISPCLCRGTLSLVHRTCLQHWLAESDSSSCELCRFIYITRRVPKYSVLGSVVAWMRQNRRQRKALLVDTLGMIAFVPFATIITYIAAALADGIEYQESPSWTDVTIRFAIVTFISIMTTVDVAYATYWMLRAQHHFSSWYSWYRRNSDVTLLPHSQQ